MLGRRKHLITPETMRLAREGHEESSRGEQRLGGLVIESAEGLRFAYAQTPLPGAEPMRLPGEMVSEAEALEIDPPATPEQQAAFGIELEAISEAERLALQDLHDRLG